jgi:hypothetical protein
VFEGSLQSVNSSSGIPTSGSVTRNINGVSGRSSAAAGNGIGNDFMHSNNANNSSILYPLFSMGMLGLAYALSNCLFWSTITDILPTGALKAPANGLIASGLNILPAIVPPLLTASMHMYSSDYYLSRVPIVLLSSLGVVASVFAMFAVFTET